MRLLLFPIWLLASVSLLFFASFSLIHLNNNNFPKISPSFGIENYSFITNYKNLLSVTPGIDIRISSLRSFLKDYHSPLYEFSEEIVKQSDIYGLDYTLIPAISFQESQGCKIIPQDSYNCWGLGIYGNKVMRFSSYPEAIEKVARTIKEAYIKKGLTNATLVEDRWTPSSKGNWSYGVNFYIGKIKEYEKKSPAY